MQKEDALIPTLTKDLDAEPIQWIIQKYRSKPSLKCADSLI